MLQELSECNSHSGVTNETGGGDEANTDELQITGFGGGGVEEIKSVTYISNFIHFKNGSNNSHPYVGVGVTDGLFCLTIGVYFKP
jgi:hypothetical protein